MIYNETRYNSQWSTKKLSELGTFARGKSKHRPRDDERLYVGGGYPLIQTGEVKAANLYITHHEQEYNEFGLAQSKLWDEGTLCITIAANIAETAILKYPMCFPDSVVGFSAFPEESSEKFMHYVFTYIRNSIQNSVAGSIQDNINIAYLSQLDFKVPPKNYQDKVVEVLGNIDEKIDTNNRICAELESMTKTLYDYWFTQFDFPNADGKPYRSSGGEMVWNDQLKRKIPKGWEATTMDALTTVLTGKEDANFSTLNGKYKFFTCAQETILCDSPAFSGHAVLIAGNGDFNVKHYTGDFNAYQRTYVLIPKEAKHYTVMYIAAQKRIQAFKQGSNGSIVKFITKGDVENIPIILPDNDAYLYTLNRILGKIEHCERENDELTKLRDWLLPMLMNGQATVE